MTSIQELYIRSFSLQYLFQPKNGRCTSFNCRVLCPWISEFTVNIFIIGMGKLFLRNSYINLQHCNLYMSCSLSMLHFLNSGDDGSLYMALLTRFYWICFGADCQCLIQIMYMYICLWKPPNLKHIYILVYFSFRIKNQFHKYPQC